MPRIFKGNKRDIPEGLEAMEWCRWVWDVMDNEGVDELEARLRVAQRHKERNG